MPTRTRPPIRAALIALALIVACSVDSGALSTQSREIEQTSAAGTDPVATYDPVDGVIDFGDSKPAQPYDAFLSAALADVESYWADEFSKVYGGQWTPLRNGIWAAWPGRSDPIPGCGSQETTYDEVVAIGAFYCVDGDFIVYDDHQLLPTLNDELGTEAVAIVLAHEFGHAIQVRAGAADELVILKEQQADCFAGAWAAHVAAGDASTISFDDADIRAALIAMIQIRDPVDSGGLANPEAHGTGFDRVGAFQDGYMGGAARCSTFFDEDRLSTLIDIPFLPPSADPTSGNLPLRDPTGSGSDIVTLIPKSLDAFWLPLLAATNTPFTPPTLAGFDPDGGAPDCGALGAEQFVDTVRWCPSNNTIYWDQALAQRLIADPLTGDLSIGFLLGTAYADAVQAALAVRVEGEDRALLGDCFAGAWVGASVPPTPTDSIIQLSAGDLDEAVVTVIGRSDPTDDTNNIGSAFERVDAFRSGVLGGLNACSAG